MSGGSYLGDRPLGENLTGQPPAAVLAFTSRPGRSRLLSAAPFFRAVWLTLFLLVLCLAASRAHADWQAGGHQELTANLVCQDIANDFTAFHPPTILLLAPEYDTSGLLIARSCVVLGIFSYTTNGSPVSPSAPAASTLILA